MNLQTAEHLLEQAQKDLKQDEAALDRATKRVRISRDNVDAWELVVTRLRAKREEMGSELGGLTTGTLVDT